MSVSKLDSDGDWMFGKSKRNYIKHSAEIKQNLVTRIKSFKNDWFLDITQNIDYFNILGNKNNEETLRSEVERVATETDGVLNVSEVTISTNKETRVATIYITYTDIFNETFQESIGITA